MNNNYEVDVYWSEQDGHFLAEVPELPSIITNGTTGIEALQNAEEMIEVNLKTAREASCQFQSRKTSRIRFKGLTGCGPSFSCFRQFEPNWRTRFVPVCALLVGVRDLQNARFVQRFA